MNGKTSSGWIVFEALRMRLLAASFGAAPRRANNAPPSPGPFNFMRRRSLLRRIR